MKKNHKKKALSKAARREGIQETKELLEEQDYVRTKPGESEAFIIVDNGTENNTKSVIHTVELELKHEEEVELTTREESSFYVPKVESKAVILSRLYERTRNRVNETPETIADLMRPDITGDEVFNAIAEGFGYSRLSGSNKER